MTSAVSVVNQEPCFTDEVVVIFVDSEVVDGFFARPRRDRSDRAPLAIDGKQTVADAQLTGMNPPG